MIMNTDEMYNEFLSFVEEKANKYPDKTVLHATWDTCAVGEFCRTFMDPEEFSLEICIMNKNLYWFLGNHTNRKDHGTYKDLWEAMKKYI